MNDYDEIFILFGAFMLYLLVYTCVFFCIRGNYGFKVRWHGYFVVFGSLLLLGSLLFMTLLGSLRRSVWMWMLLIYIALQIGLLAFLLIRFIRFCKQCGRTTFDRARFPFGLMDFCPKCGSALVDRAAKATSDTEG